MPTLAKLLLACALLMLANADDADMKRRIKLKTTRQLNEMLSEAGSRLPPAPTRRRCATWCLTTTR